MDIFADHDHPLVKDTAARLTQAETTLRGKLEQLFHYVRDDIRFAFPDDGDFVKASDTIQLGYRRAFQAADGDGQTDDAQEKIL